MIRERVRQLRPGFKSDRARDFLASAGAPLGGDYHKLPSDIVANLNSAMRLWPYAAPKHRNGSSTRYFHDMLQRKALRCPGN